MSFYASAPDAFDAEEVQVLSELASDLAFGLQKLRSHAERNRTEAALRNVLLHARTIIMDTKVTAPEGWQPNDRKWNVAHFGWDASVNDETAAQEVLPLEVPPGGSYVQSWGLAKHRADLADGFSGDQGAGRRRRELAAGIPVH
jgi:hypothetical protein